MKFGKTAAICISALLLAGCTATSTPVAAPTSNPNPTAISVAELQKHNSVHDCWIAIDGMVYDATSYLPQHPNMQIIQGCGLDATAMFHQEREHTSQEAQQILSKMKIGTLQPT